jgi:Uma2 family endonuclease
MIGVRDIKQLDPSGKRPHLLSVEKYDKMIEIGLFGEDEPIELLNGVLVEKMPKGPKHALYNDLASNVLREKFSQKAFIRNQNPIILDDYSEPEPDVALVKLPISKYFDSHPKPEDIYLVLEISDTTIGYDKNEKALAYAKAGICQYLLLNLNNETIEDYREPSFDGYFSKQTHKIGSKFSLVSFPKIEINFEDFFGK